MTIASERPVRDDATGGAPMKVGPGGRRHGAGRTLSPRVRPVRLNTTIAWLFMIGSACFVLGSVPAYADAVGGSADSLTYFVGSLFFTSASLSQLLQAQTPATIDVDEQSQHDRVPLRVWA